MKELTCIGCPNGCRLTVDEENDYAVTGNRCPVGAEYGRNELLHPQRTVTSTVKLTGAAISRLPVKTSAPVPKGKMFEVMDELEKVTAAAPVRTGETVIADVLGLGVDIVACRDMEKV